MPQKWRYLPVRLLARSVWGGGVGVGGGGGWGGGYAEISRRSGKHWAHRAHSEIRVSSPAIQNVNFSAYAADDNRSHVFDSVSAK